MALDNENKNAESGLGFNFDAGISNLNFDAAADEGSIDGLPSFDALGDSSLDIAETGAHDSLFSLDDPDLPQLKPSLAAGTPKSSQMPSVDFPALKGIGLSKQKSPSGDGLPAFKGVGLPKPKTSNDDFPSFQDLSLADNQPSSIDDLPSFKGIGLPTPKSSSLDGLPAPKSAGLPSPKSSLAAGLPSPKLGGLPTPKSSASDGLPAPKGFDLPTPKSSDPFELPIPKAADFPSLKLDDNPLGLDLDLSPEHEHLHNALNNDIILDSLPIQKTVVPGANTTARGGGNIDFMSERAPSAPASPSSPERQAISLNKSPKPRKPTMAFGMFSFDDVNSVDKNEEEEKKRTSQEERAINNAMRGFEEALSHKDVRAAEPLPPKSPAQTTAQQLPNSNFAAPKIRLNNNMSSQKSDPLGLDFSLDAFDKNGDSGLPCNDDPLGVMGMARDASAESREQRSGLLRVDFQNDSSTPIPDAISMAQIDKSLAAEKLESKKLQKSSNVPTFDALGLLSEPTAPANTPVGEVSPAETVPPTAHAAPNTPTAHAAPATPLAPPTQKAQPASQNQNGEVDEVGLQDEEIGEGEVVFDIASIKADEAQKSIITSNEKERAEKAAKESARRKRRNKIIIGCAIAFLVLAIIFALTVWIIDQKTVDEQDLAPVQEAVVNEIRDDLLRADSLDEYKKFFESALSNLNVHTITDEERIENQGKAIIGTLFGSAHYAVDIEDMILTIDKSVPEIEEAGKCNAGWCSVALWGWELINGNDDKASELEKNASADPAFSSIRQILKALAAKKKFESVSASYDEKMALLASIKDSLKDTSGWPLADYLYAEACARSGEFEKANERLAVYSESTDSKPTMGIKLLSAFIQLQLGNYTDALTQTEAIINSNSDEKSIVKQAKTLKLRAQAYSGEWKSFIKPIEDNLENYTHNLDEFAVISDICIQLGHADQCEILLKSALDGSEAKSVELHELYARVALYAAGFEKLYLDNAHLNQKALEVMAGNLAEGIKLDSSRMSLWLYRAVVEFARKNYADSMEAIVETERSIDVSWVLRVRPMVQSKIDGADNIYDAIDLESWVKEAFDPTESYVLMTFLNYANKNQQALDFADRMLKLYPQDARIRIAHLIAAMALKNREVVEADIAELKKMHALTSELQYQMARFLNDLGDPDAALKRMSQLVAQEPNNPIFLYYTGLLFFERGVYDSAKQYFEKTIGLDVSKPEPYYYNGRCAYELGDYSLALNQFNEAHNKNEHNQSYTLWMANALVKIDQPEDALHMYSVVIDNWNNDSDYQKSASDLEKHEVAVAYFERARIYQAKQKRKDASKDFTKAEAFEPENMEFAKGYAIYLYESGDVKKVIDKIKLIETMPGAMDATRYYVKGLALLKLDKRSEALTAFEYARDNGFAELEQTGITGLYDPSEIYERIGYMYRDAGRKKEAKAMLNLYLEKAKVLSEKSKREIANELERL